MSIERLKAMVDNGEELTASKVMDEVRGDDEAMMSSLLAGFNLLASKENRTPEEDRLLELAGQTLGDALSEGN